MFTGIVQGLRSIDTLQDLEGSRRLCLDLVGFTQGLELGASVAIDGTCLTLVALQGNFAEFDVIQESLRRTTLGGLRPRDQVNIERACRYGDEIGGHHVTGHIDTVGTLSSILKAPRNCDVTISHDPIWSKYLIPKGWIAVDGISLTVVDVAPGQFSVSLIPETLARTTLGFKSQGALVNLEFDHNTKVIVQTLERLLPDFLGTPESMRAKV